MDDPPVPPLPDRASAPGSGSPPRPGAPEVLGLPAAPESIPGRQWTPADDAFRDRLAGLRSKAIASYDKAVITLSGGALGVSFAFIKDVVGDRALADCAIAWLIGAWCCWAASVAAALWSFYASARAMGVAIAKLDAEKKGTQKRSEDLGSASNEWTKFLTKFAGIAFMAGVIAIIVFACLTL